MMCETAQPPSVCYAWPECVVHWCYQAGVLRCWLLQMARHARQAGRRVLLFAFLLRMLGLGARQRGCWCQSVAGARALRLLCGTCLGCGASAASAPHRVAVTLACHHARLSACAGCLHLGAGSQRLICSRQGRLLCCRPALCSPGVCRRMWGWHACMHVHAHARVR